MVAEQHLGSSRRWREEAEWRRESVPGAGQQVFKRLKLAAYLPAGEIFPCTPP
jgi:hypothetical protein